MFGWKPSSYNANKQLIHCYLFFTARRSNMNLGYKDFDIYFHMTNHYRKLKKVKSLIDFSTPRGFNSRLKNRSRSKSIQSLKDNNSSRSSSKGHSTHLPNHSEGLAKHNCILNEKKVTQCVQTDRPKDLKKPADPLRKKKSQSSNKIKSLENENDNKSKRFLDKQHNKSPLGNSSKKDPNTNTQNNSHKAVKSEQNIDVPGKNKTPRDIKDDQNLYKPVKNPSINKNQRDKTDDDNLYKPVKNAQNIDLIGRNKSPRDKTDDDNLYKPVKNAQNIDLIGRNKSPRDTKDDQHPDTGTKNLQENLQSPGKRYNKTAALCTKCSTDKNELEKKVTDSVRSGNTEYIHFLLRITEDILRNDLYTNKDMEVVFEDHIEANKQILDEVKMREEIDKLKKELDVPVDGTKRSCATLENECVCSGKSKIPSSFLENPVSLTGDLNDKPSETTLSDKPTETDLSDKSTETDLSDKPNGTDLSDKPNETDSSDKNQTDSSDKPTETSQEKVSSEDLGDLNNEHGQECICTSCQNPHCTGFQEDIKTDSPLDVDASPLMPMVEEENVYSDTDPLSTSDDENNDENDTIIDVDDQPSELSNNEVMKSDPLAEVPPPARHNNNEKRSRNICGSNRFPHQNTAACNSIPIKEILPTEMTVVTNKKPDNDSDALDLCFCASPLKKPALKIQLDREDEEDAYVVVEGKVCIPKKMYETSTVPVLLDSVESSISDSNASASAANLMLNSTCSAHQDPRKRSISSTALPLNNKSKLFTNEYDLTPQRDLPSDEVYRYLMVDAATSFTMIGAVPFQPKNKEIKEPTPQVVPKSKRKISTKSQESSQLHPRDRQLSFNKNTLQGSAPGEENEEEKNDLKIIMIPGKDFTSESEREIISKDNSLLLKDDYQTTRRQSAMLKSELKSPSKHLDNSSPVVSQNNFPKKSVDELVRRNTIISTSSFPLAPNIHMPKSKTNDNKALREKESNESLDESDEEDQPVQYKDSDDWMTKLDYKPTVHLTPSAELQIAQVTEKLQGFRTVEDDESSSLRHLYQKSAAEDKLPELEYESATTGGFQGARVNQKPSSSTKSLLCCKKKKSS